MTPRRSSAGSDEAPLGLGRGRRSDVFRAAVDEAQSLLGAAVVVGYELVDDDRWLELCAHRGLTEEEARPWQRLPIGASTISALAIEDRAPLEGAIASALAAPRPVYEREIRVERPADGAIRWIRVTASVVVEGGRAARMVGIAQDVTARREREAEARRQAEFEQQLIGRGERARVQPARDPCPRGDGGDRGERMDLGPERGAADPAVAASRPVSPIPPRP